MKHLLNIFAMLVVLMVFGTTLAMAQDATEEAPAGDVVVDVAPVDDVVGESPLPTVEERVTVTFRDAVISILVVVGAVVAFLTGAIGTVTIILSRTSGKAVTVLVEKLIESSPTQFKPAIANAVAGGLAELQTKTAGLRMPYEFDDEFVDELATGLMPTISKYVDARMIATLNEVQRRWQESQVPKPPVEATPIG